MVGKRVKSYARENERRLGRERGFPRPFPFRLPSYFLVNFACALLSERQQHATHM